MKKDSFLHQRACKMATLAVLQQAAKEAGLRNYHSMTKSQLCRALRAGPGLSGVAPRVVRHRVIKAAVLHPLQHILAHGRLPRSPYGTIKRLIFRA